MSDALILERRRSALMTAARLQRRNMGIRWSTLRGKRAVQWVESGLAATRTLGAAGGGLLPAGAGRSGGWLGRALQLAAHSRGGFFGAALRVLRRPSLWSLAMLAGRWWMRRRKRNQQRRALRARVAVVTL